jgi:hypothetical protein
VKILWAFIVLVLVAGAWMALRPAGSATAPSGPAAGTSAPPVSRQQSPAPEPRADAAVEAPTEPPAEAQPAPQATPQATPTAGAATSLAPANQTPSVAAGQPAAEAAVQGETPAPVKGQIEGQIDGQNGQAPQPVNAASATPAPQDTVPAPNAITSTPSTTNAPSAPVPDILNELLGLDLPAAATPEAGKTASEPASLVAPSAESAPASAAGEAVTGSEAAAADAVKLELSDEVRGKFKEIAPSRARRSEDGFLLLDERFPVKGDGTREKPYDLTWEMLVSASETYQPRMGKLRMPERIAMLDKRYVRITGYVAFPIMASAQNEMLSMRNMWDGCCIGVPPTPYDAIEVKLGQAATGKERFTSFGAVEGLFRVDPYVKGNWLLGLYLLEEASLVTLKEGQDPTKHRGM